MLEKYSKLELAEEIVALRTLIGNCSFGNCDSYCLWHVGDCRQQRNSQCNFGVESVLDDLDQLIIYQNMEDRNS